MPKKHCQALKTRKRRGKDLDEIVEDMKPEKLAKMQSAEPDPDLPGEGQFYCVSCARHFVSEDVLSKHKKTKAHRRREKMAGEIPYSEKEAEAAGGVGTFDYSLLNHKHK